MIVRPYAPPLTVAEYRNLPETGPRYQLIEGDLYMAPAPNRFHQDISRNLQFELHSYLKSNPISKLYDAPFDVHLDEYKAFQPDLVIVLNEHAGILTKREKKSSRGGHGGHGGFFKIGQPVALLPGFGP